MKEKKAIILNHMFTGDFLNKNIGHEVINLFATDNGDNYIYLCKDGSFNRSDIDLANSYVVQVQRPPKSYKTLEVVSVAVGLSLVDNNFESESNKNGAPEPTYGQVEVTKIFANNIQKQHRYLTFKAETVFVPKHAVYIYHGENEAVKADAHLKKYNPSQTLREYILDDTDDYKELLKVLPALGGISYSGLWQVRNPNDSKVSANEVEYLATDIYGIQTRELSYSNALAFYINKYPQFFREFFQSIKVDGSITLKELPDERPIVYREWNNIDLIFNWGQYVFLIENKICSDINGKKVDGTSQLEKYQELINKEVENKNSVFYQKEPVFIFLTTNHNDIHLKKGKWTKVNYSELLDVLNEKIKQLSDGEDYLFEDFVNAIKDQASNNLNARIMERKFKCAIQSIKK